MIWMIVTDEPWPFEGMGDDQIVQEGRVLLPDLVLLLDHSLLVLAGVRHGGSGSGSRDQDRLGFRIGTVRKRIGSSGTGHCHWVVEKAAHSQDGGTSS